MATDQRKADRLNLETRVSYALLGSDEWSEPVTLENVSGGGLRFKQKSPLTQGAELNLEIDLLDGKKPIACKGYTAWCKKDPSRDTYHIGVKLGRMNRMDRQRYVLHLCGNLLSQHLNPRGELK